jgi:hypothetical protein
MRIQKQIRAKHKRETTLTQTNNYITRGQLKKGDL